MKRILYFLPLLLCTYCTRELPAEPTGLVTENALVVSARREASEIGVEIMKKAGTFSMPW